MSPKTSKNMHAFRTDLFMRFLRFSHFLVPFWLPFELQKPSKNRYGNRYEKNMKNKPILTLNGKRGIFFFKRSMYEPSLDSSSLCALRVTISPAMRSRTKPEKWLHNTGAKIDPEMDPQIAPEAQQTQHNAHNTHTHTHTT